MTEKQIEDLIEKYANNVATEDEKSQLMDWYHSYTETEVHWPGSKKNVYDRIKKRLQAEIKAKPTRIIILPWQKVAAALIIIVGVAFFFLRTTKSVDEEMVTVINPAGMVKELQLPDGSKLWLNAQTELRYDKAFSKHREVELEGEAYFEVAHNPQHPFIIKAGKLRTEVLGTRFTIRNYEEDSLAQIALITGKIQVGEGTEKPIVLKPLTSFSFNKIENKRKISPVDTSLVLAWKSGKLQFDSESLGSITNGLARWYGVRFVFTDTAVKNCRFYMGFDNQMPLAKVISAMQELTGLQYNIDKRFVTVVGNACR